MTIMNDADIKALTLDEIAESITDARIEIQALESERIDLELKLSKLAERIEEQENHIEDLRDARTELLKKEQADRDNFISDNDIKLLQELGSMKEEAK